MLKNELKKTNNDEDRELLSKYNELLNKTQSQLSVSQFRAIIAVNQQLIDLYWQIGDVFVKQHHLSQWGDKLFDTLSKDLHRSFPKKKGFQRQI